MALAEYRHLARRNEDFGVSDPDVFKYAAAPNTTAPSRHQSHTANGPRPSYDTDEEVMQSVFEDETPLRPYAGPRSQHDRD
jgi:hypothetical protein